MTAALRFQGNLNRQQVDELQRQNPNLTIDSHFVNSFVKDLIQEAINNKLTQTSINAKKEEMKELELVAEILIKKIQRLNNV